MPQLDALREVGGQQKTDDGRDAPRWRRQRAEQKQAWPGFAPSGIAVSLNGTGEVDVAADRVLNLCFTGSVHPLILHGDPLASCRYCAGRV